MPAPDPCPSAEQPDVLYCESCDGPETDDDPLVRCERYGWMHDRCHLRACQSYLCHSTVYADD